MSSQQKTDLYPRRRYSFSSSSRKNHGALGAKVTPSLVVAPTAASLPAPPAAPDTDVGYDIVEYGASVETKDETCLTLHIETQQIETANEETSKCLEKETQTEEQLKKDLGHAKTELRSLNQGAMDQLDNAKLFLTLSQNLKQEFESTIVKSTMATSVPLSLELQDGRSKASVSPFRPTKPQAIDENNNATSTASTLSTKEIFEEKDCRANSILSTFRNEEKELKSIRVETRDRDEKSLRLQQSIESHGLEESLKRAREEGKRLESEVKRDEDTAKTRNAEIQQTREACGAKGQECMELTKKLAETKKANCDEENTLRRQLQAGMAEVEGLVKEKEEKMLQIEEQKRKNEKISKVIEDYEYYEKSKEEYNAAKAVRIEKEKELQARYTELKLKLQEQEDLEKASLLRKQTAEEEVKLAETKMKETLDKESTVVAPGKKELECLAEKKMKLAIQISDTSKILEREQTIERDALAAKADTMSEVKKKAEKLQAEVRVQEEEINAVIKEQQEFKKSHQDQISRHESISEKYLAMYETEKKVYDARYEERRKKLSGEFLRKLEDLKSAYESNKFKMEVFEQASRLLEEVGRLELESTGANTN